MKRAVFLSLLLACGHKPPPEPAPQPYPRWGPPPDMCSDRVHIAMGCWDAAAEPATTCDALARAKREELATSDPRCADSVAKSCADACAAAKDGKENRDHYEMLLTSPPP